MCVGLALLSLAFCSIEPFKETGEIFLLQEITFNALLPRVCSSCWTLLFPADIFVSVHTSKHTFLWPWLYQCLESSCIKTSDIAFFTAVLAILSLCISTWVSGPRPRCHSLPYNFSWNHDFVDQSGQGCHLTAMSFLRSVSENSLSPSRIWHHKQHRILLTPGVDSNHRQAVLSCHLMYPSSDTMNLRQYQVP